MRRLVVYGAGALGARVATAWVAAGGRAVGHTASDGRHEALRAAGVEPRLGPPEGLDPEDALLLALPGSDALTMAVAGLRDGPAPARAVVISSTSYYGVPHGPVDEDTPPGRSDRALRCVGMEKVFRDWAGAGGVVLRCGGLYQKGRGPMSALERRGEAPLGPPDKTLALIHYADAATAAFEALRHPAPRDTYLAVTPPCPTRQAFYQAACVVAGLDLPGFGPKLRKPLAEFDVARLRADLLPTPAHPRWQEALLPGDA